MNKKVAAVLAIVVVAMFAVSICSMDWKDMGYSDGVPDDGIPFQPDDGALSHESLNYALFEEYYPVLIVLGVLMFGAMIAGVCISREENDNDD